jgi:protein tyrosine kinase modulator
MSLGQMIVILKARYKLAVFVLICTVAAAVAISLYLPKKYTASTSLVVDSMNRDPISAMLLPGSLGTQMDIVKSDRVAQKVVKLLKLDEDATVKSRWQEATQGRGRIEDWVAGTLQRNLAVKPGGDGNVINIAYTAADPAFAATVANAFAQAYVDTAIELKVDPAKQYARWFSEQGKALRANLENAQARLSRYQQEKGIVANGDRMDAESSRLAALNAQLVAVQEQVSDARSKERSGIGIQDLPEVMGNPILVNLRGEIAKQESKLKDAEGNLGRNHPQYLRMQSELAELKANLETETRRITRGFSASGSLSKDKENALKAAIDAEKKKVLRLKGERDQLAVLQRDVAVAQQAYDAVATRYNQANLESQATQINVSVLNPAAAPTEPSFPKPRRKMLMVALFLGAMLGAGAALGIELLDRRIRSAADLADMLQLPVLSVIRRSGAISPSGVAALPRPLSPPMLR